MSVSIKSLNGDTSFLLTFDTLEPPQTSRSSSSESSSRPFTVLLDPWLEGSVQVLSPRFSTTKHSAAFSPCIKSLLELESEPDLVILSQDKDDHCNKATLLGLRPDGKSRFLAIPAAARKIKSWNYFDPLRVHELSAYSKHKAEDTVWRTEVSPASLCGDAGEVTVSIIKPAFNMSGVKIAIGITYRPPSGSLCSPFHNKQRFEDVYSSKPVSPPGSPVSTTSTVGCEKAISILYSPHGVPTELVFDWASSHLTSESALPLTALIHAFDCVDNPMLLGGNISTGAIGGLEIADLLMPSCWIGAHDGDKDLSGIAVKFIKIRKCEIEQIREWAGQRGIKTKENDTHGYQDTEDEEKVESPSSGLVQAPKLEVLTLQAGEAKRIEMNLALTPWFRMSSEYALNPGESMLDIFDYIH